MKLEHKIGIAITCTFLCLTGAVIGLKMQEQATPESPSVAAEPLPDDPPTSKGEPRSFDPWPEQKVKPDPNKDAIDDSVPPPEPNKKPPAQAADKPDKKPSDSSQSVVSQPMPPVPATDDKPAFAPEDKTKVEKTKESPKTASAMGDPSTFTISEPTSLDFGDSKNSGLGSDKTESPPVQPSTDGKDEWSLSPNQTEEKKDKSTLPSSPKKPGPAAASKKPSPEDKKGPKEKGFFTSIAKIDVKDNIQKMSSDPAPSATSTSPPPAPAAKLPKPASMSIGPAYLTDESANSKTSPDLKVKGPSPASAAADIGKSEEMPSPPPAPPKDVSASPAPTPAPAASAPAPSVPPPVASPTPPPTPAAAPKRAPAATPPSPPKPPADGSTYIQDASPPAPPGGGASSASAPGPLGAMPKPVPLPTSRPRAVPLASPANQGGANQGGGVKVFDEVEYVCKPGDTFQSISKRFLLSAKYAKALQRHNQNHARASSRLARTGQLTPGEKIYIPQAYILEERYADAIPKPPSAVVPAAATNNPPPPNR